jgi:hypothetical protein
VSRLFGQLYTHHSYLQVVIVNPHILQITRAHAKSSQFSFTSRFLVTDLNNEDSSASVLTSLPPGEYLASEMNF